MCWSCPGTARTPPSAPSVPTCRSGSIAAGDGTARSADGSAPAGAGAGRPLTADERPYDHTPLHTDGLPDTPTRDRNIAASAWVEAPAVLLGLGADLGHPEAAFKRRLHGWLLWRAGPARGGDARYLAIDPSDPARHFTFRLHADGSGHGTGPSGTAHSRFRTWKEDLRDHPAR